MSSLNHRTTLLIVAIAVIVTLLLGCSDGVDEATRATGARNAHAECQRQHGNCPEPEQL